MAKTINTTFKRYVEGKENPLDTPHTVPCNPAMRLPNSIERIVEAFKKSKEVSIGKEVDAQVGGEKDVTMKARKLLIVGETVRDYLLGHTPNPKEYQLVTDAHPQEVEKIMQMAKPPITVIGRDPKNGTVKVSIDGDTWKIETMRIGQKDDSPENGITFTANPAEDAGRRDFTINSIYYDPIGKKIIDYNGGLRHIQDGTIKSIGRAEDTMSKDGMRKYRYAHLLNKVPNAKVDPEMKDVIGKMKDGDDHDPDQIRTEFWKGLEDLHTNADKFLRTYDELGLLATVFPKLELNLEFPNCKTCKSRPVVLASLLKDNKPVKLVARLKELKYTDREIKDAVFLINLLIFSPEYIYDYKKELLQTSLTKRQIIDWCKINHLDQDIIGKLIDYKFQVDGNDVHEKTGLFGNDLREKVRHMEAKAFMKKMSEAAVPEAKETCEKCKGSLPAVRLRQKNGTAICLKCMRETLLKKKKS